MDKNGDRKATALLFPTPSAELWMWKCGTWTKSIVWQAFESIGAYRPKESACKNMVTSTCPYCFALIIVLHKSPYPFIYRAAVFALESAPLPHPSVETTCWKIIQHRPLAAGEALLVSPVGRYKSPQIHPRQPSFSEPSQSQCVSQQRLFPTHHTDK